MNNYRIRNALGIELRFETILFSDDTINMKFTTDPMTMLGNHDFIIDIPALCVAGFDRVLYDLALIVDYIKTTFKQPKVSFFFNYLPNARADRRFATDNAFPLKVFVQQIIAMKPSKVYVVAPHNKDALPTCWVSIEQPVYAQLLKDSIYNIDVVVYPDKGARQRFGAMFGRNGYTITFDKKRDLETGQIIGMEYCLDIRTPMVLGDKPVFFILDDICDGGRTFIECAKLLKNDYPSSIIVLGVAHGIFSKGLDVFNGLIDEIVVCNIVGTHVMQKDIIDFNRKEGAL